MNYKLLENPTIWKHERRIAHIASHHRKLRGAFTNLGLKLEDAHTKAREKNLGKKDVNRIRTALEIAGKKAILVNKRLLPKIEKLDEKYNSVDKLKDACARGEIECTKSQVEMIKLAYCDKPLGELAEGAYRLQRQE